MQRHHWMLAIAMTAVASFTGGVVATGILGTQPVSAQTAAPPSTLPPIFAEGNSVTFGPQGPTLDVLQVYGEWIFVTQHRAFATDNRLDAADDPGRFWLHVPGIHESWRLVEQ